VGPEEQALGKVSVLKDLNFCNRHEGTDRLVNTSYCNHPSVDRLMVSDRSHLSQHGSHGHPFKPIEGPCRSIYLGPIRKIELLANLQSDVEWLRQVRFRFRWSLV
jgi:hypothetical protein